MTTNTIRKIDNLRMLLLPLIIIAKIVRHTVMYQRLVLTARGWDYIPFINEGNHHFSLNVIAPDALTSNFGSVAENNAKVLAECFNIYGFTTTYYGWEIFITIVFNFLLYKVIVQYYKSHPYITKMETYLSEYYRFEHFLLLFVKRVFPNAILVCNDLGDKRNNVKTQRNH